MSFLLSFFTYFFKVEGKVKHLEIALFYRNEGIPVQNKYRCKSPLLFEDSEINLIIKSKILMDFSVLLKHFPVSFLLLKNFHFLGPFSGFRGLLQEFFEHTFVLLAENFEVSVDLVLSQLANIIILSFFSGKEIFFNFSY